VNWFTGREGAATGYVVKEPSVLGERGDAP
jgi:hypothetical protein